MKLYQARLWLGVWDETFSITTSQTFTELVGPIDVSGPLSRHISWEVTESTDCSCAIHNASSELEIHTNPIVWCWSPSSVPPLSHQDNQRVVVLQSPPWLGLACIKKKTWTCQMRKFFPVKLLGDRINEGTTDGAMEEETPEHRSSLGRYLGRTGSNTIWK
jgi:hypothetical protein